MKSDPKRHMSDKGIPHITYEQIYWAVSAVMRIVAPVVTYSFSHTVEIGRYSSIHFICDCLFVIIPCQMLIFDVSSERENTSWPLANLEFESCSDFRSLA